MKACEEKCKQYLSNIYLYEYLSKKNGILRDILRKVIGELNNQNMTSNKVKIYLRFAYKFPFGITTSNLYDQVLFLLCCQQLLVFYYISLQKFVKNN